MKFSRIFQLVIFLSLFLLFYAISTEVSLINFYHSTNTTNKNNNNSSKIDNSQQQTIEEEQDSYQSTFAGILDMAWRSHGKNNGDLVDNLVKNKIVTHKEVATAMKKVDRGDFAPSNPYKDAPQFLGIGATISAPHMHAHALETLYDVLKPGNKALDVGSGSGYLTVAMAMMVGEKGTVVGIEHIKELVDLSIKNIKKSHSKLLESKNVIIVKGDGRKGYPKEGPYDAIHVGAAADPSVPKVLCEQLKVGGKLVIPVEVGNWGNQVFRLYTKNKNGKCEYKDLLGVVYVPLTDEKKQRNRF